MPTFKKEARTVSFSFSPRSLAHCCLRHPIAAAAYIARTDGFPSSTRITIDIYDIVTITIYGIVTIATINCNAIIALITSINDSITIYAISIS